MRGHQTSNTPIYKLDFSIGLQCAPAHPPPSNKTIFLYSPAAGGGGGGGGGSARSEKFDFFHFFSPGSGASNGEVSPLTPFRFS
jgi:hypothetical protein